MRNPFLKLGVLMTMASMWIQGLAAQEAHAAASKTIGDSAKTLTTDMQEATNMVLWGGMVVGVGLIIAGAIKLTKRQGEGGLGPALMCIIAGTLAVGIPALIKIVGGSAFDDDAAGSGAVGGVEKAKR